jgi:hypothetical protein
MADSILDTTKKVLGIASDYDVFDPDILMHINSVFSTLNQLAVGPSDTFFVEDNTAVWEDFIQGKMAINAVKSYMFLRVKLLFDPPATSFALDSFQKQIQELEWRLNSLEPALTGEGTTSGSGTGFEAYIWDLSNGADFPTEAPVGAIGIDFMTGDVWRKV